MVISSLGSELRQATLRLARRIRQQRADDELSPGQSAVLAVLDRTGGSSPADLAAHEQVSPPSMNRTLNALQLAGYVSRTPSGDDRRMVVVTLTEAGREVVQATRVRRDVWLEQRLERLTPAERELLERATPVIRKLTAE
ncbi:MarR family winged helix-turn-helix transcriptional regulator [Herbiconiux liangxiaofengii]|uniref:MarR family winged helix-turn-helix transcriptional regulator n=1 Tax=Herbiconiux liangxiaofengii TaxID=3342795 RepID=UPI0035B89DF5